MMLYTNGATFSSQDQWWMSRFCFLKGISAFNIFAGISRRFQEESRDDAIFRTSIFQDIDRYTQLSLMALPDNSWKILAAKAWVPVKISKEFMFPKMARQFPNIWITNLLMENHR